MRFSVFTLFFSLLGLTGTFGQSNSVLSEGTWYKIGITKPGMYSINYQDLSSLGIDLENLNPLHISIFGNGGGMLPQKNSTPRINDLQENAILIEGEEDESFDFEDRIIFYAEGPHSWNYDKDSDSFKHEFNLYSDTNYYFLRIDNPAIGLRVSKQPEIASADKTLRTFHERIFHETDIINVNHSGRLWLGEIFDDNLEQTFGFDLSEIASEAFNIEIATAARSARYNSSSPESKPLMTIYANQLLIDTVKYNTNTVLSENLYVPVTDYRIQQKDLNSDLLNNGQLDLKFVYNKNGVLSPAAYLLYAGFLDYIKIEFEKKLTFTSYQQTSFRSTIADGNSTLSFKFPNLADVKVWEITNPINPYSVNQIQEADSSSFNFSASEINEFISFTNTNLYSPSTITALNNQNIRGISITPQLIIVVPKELKPQALRLADLHENNDGLTSLVVTPEEIYNEFSSGKRDVSSIRDLCKYFYDQENGLKYLLLFGMGSYDFKNINNHPDFKNFIPIYQSRESFHPITSYASDDYFGFLEPDEGDWRESSIGNHSMDIGIGRLPARNLTEAQNIIDKIYTYSTDPRSLGSWRSNFTLFGDDGDYNLHLYDCESIARKISTIQPNFNISKLYVGLYEKTTIPGVKEVVPELTERFTKTLNEGTLIFNYIGHGAPRNLGAIIDKDLVNTLDNKYSLPFFVTATCEFAVADHPDVYSLGRELILKKDIGGIGILSGARPAYSSANKILLNSLMNYIFNPELKFGDIIRNTKNNSLSGVRNRHFIFLGDPALRMNLPKNSINITSINDSTYAPGDTLPTLETVKLKGEVTDINDNILSDFSGDLNLKIFDREKSYTTLGQESTDDPVTFKERRDKLFEGNTYVQNGLFEIEFMLPIQARDSVASAKFSFYASNNNLKDAFGSNFDFQTGAEPLGIFKSKASNLSINAYPNPFNETTSLVLTEINGQEKVSIFIRDLRGLLIKEITDIRIEPGEPIYWDGTDQSGGKVNEGIYPCTISIPEKNMQQTILLMVR